MSTGPGRTAYGWHSMNTQPEQPAGNANRGTEPPVKNTDEFLVKFWGVRGSIACPGPSTLKYGGNTSCVEVHCGDYNLIFDMGTGIKDLGESMMKVGPMNVDIFLSHTHSDHINGFPFFKPAYSPGNRLKIHAGHLEHEQKIEEVIRRVMQQPFFPVTVDILQAELVFVDFKAGDTLKVSDQITMKTALLNHPNGATGYRIEYNGKAVCYVTDTEHVPGKPDENILKLIDGADIFIYDSNFTDEEFPNFVGWGHSTWQEGARLADLAGVKTFVVFHHAPNHDDIFMDRLAEQLERVRPGSVVAREGLQLRL